LTATAARQAALAVLCAVRDGDLADHALRRQSRKLSPRDRAWLQELVFGTLRLRNRLDHILAGKVRPGLAALEPDVLDLLRLAAYQLLEMQGVPAYAAVSQAVEQAKRVSGRPAASLVNGVLRTLRREGPGPFPSFEADPVQHLVTWGSHPRWLIERWLERWGPAATLRLVEANNRRADIFLRPVRFPAPAARAALSAAGVNTEALPLAPDSLRLSDSADVHRALEAVPAVVQDPAAALVVRYAAAPSSGVLADLCAAPGGKALALAGGIDPGKGVLLAADVSPRRLRRLRENALRLRDLPLQLAVADARQPPLRRADFVLLDAPCTGTGTFRRHPDARWRIGPADLAALVQLQREMLRAAAGLVVPGGRLVYATCSLEAEENEQQVDWFLNEFGAFAATHGGTVDASLLDAEGRLFVTPQAHGFDGAFAARLHRRSP
jgi:16S rRNA (cytosine967-C5)-methyltransferase